LKTITFDNIDASKAKACIDNIPINNNDFIFVSDGTWFVKDSICWLEANCGHMGGLFVGNYRIDDETEAHNRRMTIGEIQLLDGELCSWSEFDIYDKNRNLMVKANEQT